MSATLSEHGGELFAHEVALLATIGAMRGDLEWPENQALVRGLESFADSDPSDRNMFDNFRDSWRSPRCIPGVRDRTQR